VLSPEERQIPSLVQQLDDLLSQAASSDLGELYLTNVAAMGRTAPIR
jgi:hypothetical protein